MFYHLYAKATIALHAMKKISAQSAPKATQVAKRTMVDTPFIIEELAYATIILGHGQSIARRGLTIWTNRLNIQTLHAHHLHH